MTDAKKALDNFRRFFAATGGFMPTPHCADLCAVSLYLTRQSIRVFGVGRASDGAPPSH